MIPVQGSLTGQTSRINRYSFALAVGWTCYIVAATGFELVSSNNFIASDEFATTRPIFLWIILGHAILWAIGLGGLLVARWLILRDTWQQEASNRSLWEISEQYRVLTHSVLDGFCQIDATGHLLGVNDAYCHMTGYSQAELRTMSIADLEAAESLAEVKMQLQTATEAGNNRFESQHRCRDGRVIDVQVSATYIPHSRQIMAFVQDITARKKAQVALAESEQLLREIAANFPNAFLFIIEADHTIGFASGQEFSKMGLDPEQFTGLGLEQFFREQTAVVRAYYERTFQGEACTFELFINEQHQIHRTVPLAAEDGSIPRILAVAENYTTRKQVEMALQNAKDYAENIIQTANVIVVGLDTTGDILVFNDTAERITGYTRAELANSNWFEVLAPRARYPDVWEMFQQLPAGEIVRQFENPILTKDGEERYIAWQNNHIQASGQITGTISFGLDITERRRADHLLQARLHLSEFALTHTLSELLQETLDEAELLTASQIGFIHFVEEDQNQLWLQVWSTNTEQQSCTAEGEGLHYPIAEAGVWVDCIHQRRPVIHNDYASLAHRQGMPDGHASITRELVVPVFQDDSIVAVLGVGNKTSDYTEVDVHTVVQLANMSWDIVKRKQMENIEREQRALATALAHNAEVLNSTLNLDMVIQRILYAVADVVPHDGSNIMLMTEDRTGVRIVQICECYATNDLLEPVAGEVWQLDKYPHLQQMIETREAMVVPDVRAYDDWVNMFGIRSYVAAPIVTDGLVIGFLNVDSSTPDFFTAKHAEHLKAFANQAATALQNAQMFQQLASYSGDLEQAVAERTAELMAANEELEKLSRAKDEFVSNVSHELRTPIAGMRLHHYLLRKRPERLDQYLGVIERETYRLENTIEDLLRLSRLDQGRIDVTMTTVDLNEMVKQFVADRSLSAEDLGLALRFEPPATAVIVLADQGLLGQVLSILLTNAFNYTPAGGQVTVSTHTRQDESQTWMGFSVHDTGPGIDPAEQVQLFERFYRGIVGQESQVQGTGLGLAIAHSIVDLHQGQITVESMGITGEGATFTVWLPDGPTATG